MRDPHTVGNGSSEWIEAQPESSARSLNSSRHEFVARQSIFDQLGEVHGYELLYRPGSQNRFFGQPDMATRRILGKYLLYGLGAVTGGCLTFVNCSREALVGGWISLLPRATTIVELVGTVRPDDEVVDACGSLKRMGYSIALDDFQFSAEMQPLVELADYVKIDFRLPESVRRNTLRQLESSRAKLVAEKVETEEELRAAFDEGFELFQGYFLEFPRMYSRCKRVNALDRRSLPNAITWPEPQAAEAIGEVSGFRPALA